MYNRTGRNHVRNWNKSDLDEEQKIVKNYVSNYYLCGFINRAGIVIHALHIAYE